jgi:outer membrane protein assembly factor BamB
LKEVDGKIIAEPQFLHPTDVFGSIQQTPILYKDYIYGIRPDKRLVCMNLDGEIEWTSPTTHLFGSRGLGPYIIANGNIFVLDDEGVLTIIEASPNSYNQLTETKAMDGHEAWGPMAIASGRLIIRDLTRMICLDISEQ